jgi:hypothetical protein
MHSPVAAPSPISRDAAQLTRLSDVSYTTFKQAFFTLYEQGKEETIEGDFRVLARGLQLLNELGVLFPDHAARLADEPEFLS